MADPFSNEPIPIDHLPRLSDDAFVPVDPRYLRVSLTGIALTALVVVAGAVLIAMQIDQPALPLLIGGGVVLLLVVVAVSRVLEVRRLAYQLREHDLSLRSGVITHRVESLPFSRIQHVNVHRGPIERSLGLATLRVSTAGPDISIPGLAEADAERIKLLVTERADVVDDEAAADISSHGETSDETQRSPQTDPENLQPRGSGTTRAADLTSLPPPQPTTTPPPG